MIWLIVGYAAAGVLWLALLAEEMWFERRPLPPVGQSVKAPPPLPGPPPSWGHPDDSRRAHLPGPGRHRSPGGPA